MPLCQAIAEPVVPDDSLGHVWATTVQATTVQATTVQATPVQATPVQAINVQAITVQAITVQATTRWQNATQSTLSKTSQAFFLSKTSRQTGLVVTDSAKIVALRHSPVTAAERILKSSLEYGSKQVSTITPDQAHACQSDGREAF